MHREQRQQTQDLLNKNHVEQAVFAKPESIKWLTGFAPPVQTGGSLFTASYPLLWYDRGQFTLLVVDAYADLAAPFGQEPDGHVVPYLGYTVEQPITSAQHLMDALGKVADLRRSERLGVEREYVSDVVGAYLRQTDPRIVPIDSWLEPLRMIKTAEELAMLRRNFELADVGQAAARKAVAAGKREIDVWNALHGAIQQAAGCRVPVGNDCVVGYRQENVGGWPLDYELHPHDSLIVDISVILGGYWSDGCATYYVGERTAQQEKMHRTVLDALALGISLVRPGAVAREIDREMRQFMSNAGYPVYPHHTGHGVGVSGHEAPRLVPYSNEVLRAGMVIMLEPGIYFPGETNIRLEDGMLVTPDGAELLTHHDKS